MNNILLYIFLIVLSHKARRDIYSKDHIWHTIDIPHNLRVFSSQWSVDTITEQSVNNLNIFMYLRQKELVVNHMKQVGRDIDQTLFISLTVRRQRMSAFVEENRDITS